MIEPRLTDTARKVLAQRYLMRDEDGDIIETPAELFRRVARFIAQAERWNNDPEEVWPAFYESMARGDFMPNTPCLINAGRPHSQGQFSACFVLPVLDDMKSIFETLGHMAMIHKSGGGTGFSFSNIRPYLDFVRSTTGIASGPVSFMRAYDHVTECVKQSGARRGANMGILRVDHPDVRAFIECKRNTSEITNFNISVAITDTFMEAYFEDGTYSLVNPRTRKEVAQERARDIWDLIVKRAHETGEPGMFFIDRANKSDPLAHNEDRRIEATNPCGEVPLCAYNACTLGSINLSNFYQDGKLDFERLAKQVRLSVRFLDDVLEQNQYPVSEISKTTAATRKIGLGVMGWADLLVKVGVPYSSDEAFRLAAETMSFVNKRAVEASEMLAEERGAFPDWDRSRWAREGHKPRRNSTVTVIAPTGSISIIAGCSSGIEPLFALCQERRQADLVMHDFSPLFRQVAEREGFWSDEVRDYVTKHGSVRDCANVPFRWREVFAIANEVDPLVHVRVQGAFQEYTEDAVSKTINLPSKSSLRDVDAAYMAAWANGCKGITVYRDGSRPNQTLTAGIKEESERRRIPDNGHRAGATFTTKTAYGSVHITINEHPDDREPFELFVTMGKGGSEISAWSEALGRATSLMLATSREPRQRLVELVEQLAGIGGGGSRGFGENRVVSAADGVAKCILMYLGVDRESTVLDLCPECKQAALVKGGGCDVCTNCGHSKC